MHVTSDGENVDVWIRDSELSPLQSQNVVGRLASEFADSGMRLNSATVNGKLEYRPDDEIPPLADRVTADARDPGTGADHSIVTTTREDHAA